jgi:hypothetical protein
MDFKISDDRTCYELYEVMHEIRVMCLMNHDRQVGIEMEVLMDRQTVSIDSRLNPYTCIRSTIYT